MQPALDPFRQRAIKLFQYLSALAELREKAVRDYDSYESTFSFHDLPKEPECFTVAWDTTEHADEDSWLWIKKPKKPPLPQPPGSCKWWYAAKSLEDLAATPPLYDSIPDPQWRKEQISESDEELETDQQKILHLSDFPQIKTAWQKYLQAEWHPWTLLYRRWERIHKAYGKLFSIYQEQQRRGEQYELLIGVGTLVWSTERNHKVRRPILVARATIELEGESGCIRIGPTADGADFTLEQDMLEVDERPPIKDQEVVKQGVTQLESLWDRERVEPLLKRWLQTLNSAGDAIYQSTLAIPEGISATPQMAYAPMVILRRRGARSMRDALKKIIGQLSDAKSQSIPRGIGILCGDRERKPGEPRENPAANTPVEILFPLPTNQEQREIIHRLGNHTGVLVQGPPGTGKSHTIVNLLSHFLAEGKRVLVTSKTPRALKVLREKIPSSIQPLAVSLLGDDSESKESLEQSVKGIVRHVDRADSRTNDRKAASLVNELRACFTRLADLRRRQREFREIEITPHIISGTPYAGTAQVIAKAVSSDNSRFAWLEDTVLEQQEPLLTVDSLEELIKLRDRFNSDLSLAEIEFPALQKLPVAADFAQVVSSFHDAHQYLVNQAIVRTPRVEVFTKLDHARLEEISINATDYAKRVRWIENRQESWIGRAWKDIVEGKAALAWRALAQETEQAVQFMKPFSGSHSDSDLEISISVSRSHLAADVETLATHLKSGRGFGVLFFRPKEVNRLKYLWKDSRFQGKLCDNITTLQSLKNYLEVKSTLEKILLEWSPFQKTVEGTFRLQLAALEECGKILQVLFSLESLARKIRSFLSSTGIPLTSVTPQLGNDLLTDLNTAKAIVNANAKQARLSFFKERIRQEIQPSEHCHRVVGELAEAINRNDPKAYHAKRDILASLLMSQEQVKRLLSLDTKLRRVAPRLAEAIEDPDRRAAVSQHLSDFNAAWAHKRASQWLIRFEKEHAAEQILIEIQKLEVQSRQITEQLVALKSWQFCIDTLQDKPELQGALIAWQQTVELIGKGTGKHAETHRRDARKYMQQCRNAIPVWIMPLHRVAEQVEIEPEVFDIIIVDEASQTGPEGLILQYLGKQCIIVGDDKQISPEAGFIDGGQVQTLIQQYLHDLPFASTLGPASSLFDQAAVRYGKRITLREHFRCMPEIIRFSNDLCYADTPLIPLRQYAPVRLPPIQARYVTDGYKEGQGQKTINRAEAAALTATFIQCWEDARYQNKSFGIICLQGQAQAQLIESMILERLGPAPFKSDKTRLLCGDPYSFQGDERDVVMMSMVAAVDGDSRSAALTRETFRQRFNVAASRARDQMWLFHSVRESDLHPDCMRRRLLRYFYNPTENKENDLEDLYESAFERDVASELMRAGYRVIPQYEVAGKRIDLVIEDGSRRMAVECDGDFWHGPEQYEHDMDRQRMLERCGWTFIRIRGSVFYANREKAMKYLLESIAAHGIAKAGVSEIIPDGDWIAEISGRECLASLNYQTDELVEEEASEDDFEAEDPGPEEPISQPKATIAVAKEAVLDESDPDVESEIALLDPDEPDQQESIEHTKATSISDEDGEPFVLSNESQSRPIESTETLSEEDLAEYATRESKKWFEIARWSKEQNLLEGWQRRLAFSLGLRYGNRQTPTEKQAKQGRIILDIVYEHGFVDPE